MWIARYFGSSRRSDSRKTSERGRGVNPIELFELALDNEVKWIASDASFIREVL